MMAKLFFKNALDAVALNSTTLLLRDAETKTKKARTYTRRL